MVPSVVRTVVSFSSVSVYTSALFSCLKTYFTELSEQTEHSAKASFGSSQPAEQVFKAQTPPRASALSPRLQCKRVFLRIRGGKTPN